MAFVKLDTGVLDSTLWIDRPCREIFITALLMAEPIELIEPMTQFEVRAIKTTNFIVPPGWYGFVRAAGVGIVNRALVEQETGISALERLGDPDPESRSKEYEGRRLIRVDGGYIILNYFKYRDRDHTAAERQKRMRERKRNAVTSRNVTVTSHIADADADAEKSESQRRATRLPSDFSLSEDLREFAKGRGLDPDRTLEAFRDYWQSAPKGAKLDWNATFRTWCRNEKKAVSVPLVIDDPLKKVMASRAAIGMTTFRDPLRNETPSEYRLALDAAWTEKHR